ncbi:MAG TPA: tRNA (adenosine(37)-N6)-threonylcarbamoyltransferase complex transferase subunit TsaD [Candidatus Marinimicrobia bacterium]|nr:tRNA (adenosine(37)-N6)-threonylcarbamoyltransferase complex transferase subunit TsaD [Candidatus Neomarinimicrobiota bacterium]HIM27811.1 tRNA (adenosine(37)-N6)-threonylcarbamoyltransferase complex transferase subunit TsaD [Candidatus Neomarinimicrobiota bacterium]
MIILGIESSCDETAAAICKNGNILSSIVSSQQIHKNFGGVVPEVASREHERLLNYSVEKALDEAEIALSDLDGVGVTQGPGLAGALITGVCFAKGLSQSLNIPILGINHLEAHIYANFLADPTLVYPLVCLLVSGGHTQLWLVKEMADYELLGESRDDAAGEAFDKGGRILGLDYPGGPAIEKMAHNGDCKAIDFPRAFYKDESLEFSFSGLKTSLLYFMEKKDKSVVLADVAASYQKAILDVLVYKLATAVKRKNVRTCVIAGGVAANNELRNMVKKTIGDEISVLYPEPALCTDNAAMVAYLSQLYMEKGFTSPIDFDVFPNLKVV